MPIICCDWWFLEPRLSWSPDWLDGLASFIRGARTGAENIFRQNLQGGYRAPCSMILISRFILSVTVLNEREVQFYTAEQ